MVRVFKCHSFSSKQVVSLPKEPLTIFADDDKVFVATTDCEIIVFRVSNGSYTELYRCPTISDVAQLTFNSFKNYIATVELKKSWRRITKSVRVYLNCDQVRQDGVKPRTKVRIAGKSHVQQSSTATGLSSTVSRSLQDSLEVIEVPIGGQATSIAVCRYTGNFAVACGSEVKLCSLVEKTVANSSQTYLDVEVFLELCWSFPVLSISLCEEFVICCSKKEVHGICVKYDEGERLSPKSRRKILTPSPSMSSNSGGRRTSASNFDAGTESSGAATPQSFVSETFLFADSRSAQNKELETLSMDDSSRKQIVPSKDLSLVGVASCGRSSPRILPSKFSKNSPVEITEDEHYIEWNFQEFGSDIQSVCLPGLHTNANQAQCHHHGNIISPPVLSDFSGGRVKSSSGVRAETVLHLSDSLEKEEWMSVVLVPSYSGSSNPRVRTTVVSTDRMRSVASSTRTNMCCLVTGSRGGYMYQLSPHLQLVSTYKYTSPASQVCTNESHLYVVTTTGIETYTSRWGALSFEALEHDSDESQTLLKHPPSNLDICLVGHEPFFGAVNVSIGTDFLALLSKMPDPSNESCFLWSLYVLHSYSLVEEFNDMISFTEKMSVSGPASHVHLLQEAHLLLCSHPLYQVIQDVEVIECIHKVSKLLGRFYSQPGQEDWALCWPYYKSSKVTVSDVMQEMLQDVNKGNHSEFGKGLLDYLDRALFTEEEVTVPSEILDLILKVYAVAAPDRLSTLILSSNLKNVSNESAFHHLKTWLSLKASTSKPISTTDKLAMVQLHLAMCDIELATTELESIEKRELIKTCLEYPKLIQETLTSFSPLAQLMRRRQSSVLLEVLVEMVDKCALSMDSLLILLRNQDQSDVYENNHIKEVLELILSDKKRSFLFDTCSQMLCEIYVTRIQRRIRSAPKHHKFVLPQGNGHFATRYGWLDQLPPFFDQQRMSRPCLHVDMKSIPGGLMRSMSRALPISSSKADMEDCPCCLCNDNLLKLQSLLCSSLVTKDLAKYVFDLLPTRADSNSAILATWDSVRILCVTKLDLDRAGEEILDLYPSCVGNFASCCLHADYDKYQVLLRYCENLMKNYSDKQTPFSETVYVTAYKDLLTRLSVTMTPTSFVEILPDDGNLFFLLPFICSNLQNENTELLKRKIMDMGKQLVTLN